MINDKIKKEKMYYILKFISSFTSSNFLTHAVFQQWLSCLNEAVRNINVMVI